MTAYRRDATGWMRYLRAALILGLGAALVATPVVYATGSAVKQTAATWNVLPPEIIDPPIPQGSVLLAKDGKTQIATLFEYDRRPVTVNQISSQMRSSIIGIEDMRFYSNPGVDLRGTIRALLSSASGRGRQGGSSITQQYIKNALLLQAKTKKQAAAATEVSAGRKIREARYATAITTKFSKDQILEKYLNIAYFGAGAYGIEAAAQRYFSIPASKLDVAQSALLTGLVQNPVGYDPFDHPKAATKRRNDVLRRLAEIHVITPAQRSRAAKAGLGLKPTLPKNGCIGSVAPFYCDWVLRQLAADPKLGSTTAARMKRLREGGLTIVTGLDLAVQRKAQEAADKPLSRQHRVAVVNVVLEPGTGVVRAIAVNRSFGPDKGQTMVPLASTRSYQPGSTFKAFGLVAALEKGLPLTLRLPGGDSYRSRKFNNPEPRGAFRNAADGHGSNLSLTQATAESVNTAFIQLEEMTGVLPVADAARRAGIALRPEGTKGAPGKRDGSLVLGTYESSPLDMAAAYATFAAHGMYCPAHGAVQVRDEDDRPVAISNTTCRRAYSVAVADTVTSLLVSVLEPGGTAEKKAVKDRPTAGKTGTTDGSASAWFVGYTPSVLDLVMLSDPRGAQQHPLHNINGLHRVYGGDIPADVWHDTMVAILDGTPVEKFRDADPAYVFGTPTPVVPNVVGQRSADAARRLSSLELTSTVTRVAPPAASADIVAPGIVLGQSPAPGTQLKPGSTVTLRVSR